MAKQLLIVRHGKADKGSFDLKDFDRPLNSRGHRDAIHMAEQILKKDLIPQFIVSSPAVRALTTAEHFSEVWNIPSNRMQTESSIYEASVRTLLYVINHLDNDFDRIAIFGHNPGFTELANYLSNTRIFDIPTSGVVVVDFSLNDWAKIHQYSGEVTFFEYPKIADV